MGITSAACHNPLITSALKAPSSAVKRLKLWRVRSESHATTIATTIVVIWIRLSPFCWVTFESAEEIQRRESPSLAAMTLLWAARLKDDPQSQLAACRVGTYLFQSKPLSTELMGLVFFLVSHTQKRLSQILPL